MSDSHMHTSNGIGFTGLLTIVFVVLKLTGYITWSWWWVVSPLWVSVLVGVLVLVAFAIGFVVYRLVKG